MSSPLWLFERHAHVEDYRGWWLAGCLAVDIPRGATLSERQSQMIDAILAQLTLGGEWSEDGSAITEDVLKAWWGKSLNVEVRVAGENGRAEFRLPDEEDKPAGQPLH
jgi:hypothetical protein